MNADIQIKEYKIEGMDCADCARHLADSIRKIEGVAEADINFITTRLKVSCNGDEDFNEQITRVVKKAGYKATAGSEETKITFLSIPELSKLKNIDRDLTEISNISGIMKIDNNRLENVLTVHHTLELNQLLEIFHTKGINAELRIERNHKSDQVKNFLHGRKIQVLVSGLFISVGAILDSTSFHMSVPLTFIILGVLAGGYPIAKRGLQEARNLKLGMNFLMTIAVLGAMTIGEWLEAGAVVFLFALAQYLETRSMEKARKSVNALIDESPKTAAVILNDNIEYVPVSSVQINQVIAVKPGEQIPLDGIVIKGSSFIDQASITGESMPVRKRVADRVYAGTLNKKGYLEIQVDRPYSESTFSKIIHLVIEAQTKKAVRQTFIDRFAYYYTPLVILIAFLIVLIPTIFFNQSFSEWFYRSLVLLVIACPCALVISTPVSIVSALTAAMRNGVLVKGGIYLENFSKIDAIAFDKTGTLTAGKPRVQEVIALNSNSKDLIRIAASLEKKSEHPIADAIVEYADEQITPLDEVKDFKSIEGKGIEGSINHKKYIIGNHHFFEERGWCDDAIHDALQRVEDEMNTAVLVGDGKQVLGIISISDALRDGSADIVRELQKDGIKKIELISGDNRRTAEKIADTIGITSFQSELLPQDKVRVIDQLRSEYAHVAMVGDGVNDAPALATADIGIAMGTGSSDAALDNADVVLMKDDLSKLLFLRRLSSRTLNIIKQNIIIALGLKFIFLALAIPGLATLWMAVFADMGASLIVIFNGLRPLKTNQNNNT